MTKRLPGAALSVLAALAPAIGLAQPGPLVLADKFSIIPPLGWRQADPQAVQRAGRPIGEKIGVKAAFEGKPPLAVFLAPTPTQGFASNLNIREVPEVVSASEGTLAEIRAKMEGGVGAIKPSIENAEITTVGGRKALRLEWKATILNIPVRAVQVSYPGKAATFIATYTTHAAAWAQEHSSIEDSIQSFLNLEPWYAWVYGNKIVLYGLIGAVVGVFFFLLVRRR